MIKGHFATIDGRKCVVEFGCDANIDIGDNPEEDFTDIKFDATPLTIEEDIEDTFDRLVKTSASITLLTDIYLGDYLYASLDRDITVNIYFEDSEGNKDILFVGYVQPITFSQNYVQPWEKLEVNCQNYLCTLENHRYREDVDYDELKEIATNKSFYEIFKGIFGDSKLYYDQSISLLNENKNIFKDTYISELLFLGDEEDDCWTDEDIVLEILQYLNLRMKQVGTDFYIFNKDSLMYLDQLKFIDLDDSSTESYMTVVGNDIVKANYSSNDTNITINEVYQQIKINCDIENLEDVIENPIDSDGLYSPFVNKQLYAERLLCEGEGHDACEAFWNQIKGNDTSYEAAQKEKHFIQVYKNKNWELNTDAFIETLNTSGTYQNQQEVLKYLHDNTCKAAIISMGTADQEKLSDNTPIATVDMEENLVISVNGNREQDESTVFPDDDDLKNACGDYIAKYTGNISGGVYTPTSSDTTNYLVFSGKFTMKSRFLESCNYLYVKNYSGDEYSSPYDAKDDNFLGQGDISYYTYPDNIYGDGQIGSASVQTGVYLVPRIPFSDDGAAYFCTKYYKATNPNGTAEEADTNNYIQPFYDDFGSEGDMSHGGVGDEKFKKLNYNFAAVGDDAIDTFTKLPILSCELKIGDKYCIEWDDNGNFTENQFRWVEYDDIPELNGVKLSTFTLGCNPALKDWIINEEYDIANTIDYTMNLDTEGTAIPIHSTDAVSGQVQFKILGPFNVVWNTITRLHPSFWRHTKWGEEARFVLSYLEYIMISKFECKLVSDNGKTNNTVEKDLVYISNETNSLQNIKELDFKICTALTSAEAAAKGVLDGVKLCNPLDYNNNPITSYKNNITGETGKAEELFIDSYFKEYHSPKIQIESTMHLDEFPTDETIKHRYNFSYFPERAFTVIKQTIEPKMNRTTLTFKETCKQDD